MDQTVNPRLNLNESTKVGDVAHFAPKHGSRRIARCNPLPGVGLELLHPKRDLLHIIINAHDRDFYNLPQRDPLRWMADMSSPTHLRYMHKSLNSLLQLKECPIVRNGDHLALNHIPFLVTLLDIVPGMGLQLLQPQ